MSIITCKYEKNRTIRQFRPCLVKIVKSCIIDWFAKEVYQPSASQEGYLPLSCKNEIRCASLASDLHWTKNVYVVDLLHSFMGFSTHLLSELPLLLSNHNRQIKKFIPFYSYFYCFLIHGDR
jgi:hypothetical protein